jgi:hypothetical protein
MSDFISGQESVFQFPWGSAAGRDTRKQNQRAVTAELLAARTRETAWLREKSDLLQRQDMLTQESAATSLLWANSGLKTAEMRFPVRQFPASQGRRR